MPNYNKVLKSMPHNAVGTKRIVSVASGSSISSVSYIPGSYHYVVAQTGGSNVTGSSQQLFGERIILSGSSGGGLKLYEGTSNGVHSLTVKAPDAVTTDKTLTLPDGPPTTSGYALVSTTAGVMSWAAFSGGNSYITGLAYAPSTQKLTATLSDSSTVVQSPSLNEFGQTIRLSNADNVGEARFYEKGTSGSDYVAFRGPTGAMASSYFLALPSALGSTGQVLAHGGSGELIWTNNDDANYFVTGGTYDAGNDEIDFSGNTGFPAFSVDTSAFAKGSIAGTATYVPYFTASTALTGTNTFTWDNANGVLSLTNNVGSTAPHTGHPKLSLININADGYPSMLEFYKNSASPASTDLIGYTRYAANNSAGAKTTFVEIATQSTSVTDGSEGSEYEIFTMNNGTKTKGFRTASGNVYLLDTEVTGTFSTTGIATLGNNSVTNTQTAGNNSTRIATTAFVTTAVAAAGTMSSWTVRTDTGAGGAASVTNAAVVDFVGNDGITTSNSGLSASWSVDNTVVRTTGVQSIGGAKTFTSLLTASNGLTVSAGSALTVSGNTTLQNPLIIQTGSATKFNFKPDDQAEELLITGTKKTTAATEYAYYPRIVLDSDEDADALSQPGYPSVFFTKFGPTSIANPAGDPVGWRMAASGSAGIASAPQSLVWDYSSDQSTYSNKLILSEAGVLTAATFTGQLLGTIASTTTATTQSAGNSTTKVATTAFVASAISGGGLGTVTSVAVAGNNGISVSGSPITSNGTITLGLSNLANSVLANSTVSYGGVSLALGATDATPAFNLTDATNYEGAAIKSTGEGGGSKFLREDGDGTSSWQAVPASSPAGSNTQLQYNNGGAFGGVDDWTWNGTDMTIATGSKLIFGDANRYIDEDGAHLRIRNSETGGNIDLNAKNSFRFYIDGAQKMSISSAGNATFTSAVTLGDNSVTNTQTAGNSTTRIATTAFVAAAVAAGGNGDVSKVGTPANNQIGVWTGDGTIEGNNDFTYDAGTLDINDRLNIIAAGAAGTPNIFQPSQDGKEIQFRAYSSNLDIMRLTDAGKVGIGTTAPAVKLDVRDAGWPIAAFHGTSEYGTGIQLYNTHTTAQTWAILGGGTSQSNYPLKFYDQTNSVYRMVLDNTGKLGIGTTSPESKLHINGGAYLAQFSRGTGDFTLIQSNDTNNLIFATGTPSSNTEIMTINSTGVGIGTTSPPNALTVHKAIANDFVTELKNTHATAGQSWGLQVCAGTNSSDAALAVENEAEDTSLFYVRGDGNVGIGTTNPIQPLHVLTSANDKGILIDVSDNTHEGRLIFGDVASNGVGHIGYNHSMETMRFTVGGFETVRMAADANYKKLFLGGDSTLGFYRYGNRMDFYISSNPRMHLDAGKLYSASSGGPLLDLTPTTNEANYGFVDDPDTGMSRSSANTLHFLTAGVTGATMDNQQRVALGTSTIHGNSRLTISQAGTSDNHGISMTSDGSNFQHIYVDANDKLILKGTNDVNLTATDDINLTAGTTTDHDIYMGSDNVLIYNANYAAQYVQFDGGTQRVGIGTTAPAKTLHIKKDAGHFRISSADYDLISMGPRGDTGSNLDKAQLNMMHGDGSSKIYFDTGGDSYIKGAGGLGLGTSTITSGFLLDVSGATRVYGSMSLVNGAITSNPGTNHLWASGSTLFWGGSQIGTTTPGAGAIQGTATAGEVAYGDGSNSITSSSNFQYDGNNLKLIDSKKAIFGTGDDLQIYHNGTNSYLDSQTGDFRIQNYASDKDIIFKIKDNTTETEVMRIDGSTSRVGIGTTAPNNTLEVAGVIRGTNYIWQKQDGSPGILVGNGGNADIYYDGTDLNINAARGGSGILKIATNTTVTGVLSATAKSFNIPHPLYKDKRLVHGSLEGPEHAIYIRGTIETEEKGCLVELPEYWSAMCEDYTVQLTPHGPYTVYIKEKLKDKVMIECSQKKFKFDYYIVGARTDETLEVVQDA